MCSLSLGRIARTTYVVYCSVCLSVTLVSPAKTAKPIEIPFVLRTPVGPVNHVLDEGPDPPQEGAILGERTVHWKVYRDFCRELCENGWISWFAVWIVDSGGPKEAQIQSYSPGGANLSSTIEPSMCGGDAACCQITLTTCYYYVQACQKVFHQTEFKIHHVSKTSYIRLAITLKHVKRFWYSFAEMLSIKQAIKRCHFTMPSQIACASALPGKIGKHDNHFWDSVEWFLGNRL